jgi:hypothetical protein
MGNTKLRKLTSSESKWTDKEASKHKHKFTIHTLMILRNMDNRVEYYDVMKCEHCDSFRSIKKPGSVSGLISKEQLTSDMMEMPKLRMYRSHRWSIGFNDMVKEL